MLDLQINGLSRANSNCNFWSLDEDPSLYLASIEWLSKEMLKESVSAYLATVITNSYEAIDNSLSKINHAMKVLDFENLSEIRGVHIEGGLISKYGVHSEAYADEFNYQKVNDFIKKYPKLIKLWTLCPKLDRDGSITKLLQDNNIVVSYGHSAASYDEANEAFDKYKVNLVTHWANAMNVFKGFKHRRSMGSDAESSWDLLDQPDNSETKAEDLGLGLAAYRRDDIYLMAICGSKEDQDLHIEPELIKKIADKKAERLILVSDLVSLDEDKKAELAKGILQGGLASLAKHAQNALKAGLSEQQVKLATKDNPERIFL